jgi:hypothetical protein
MRRALQLGLLYFAAIFALGFVLGSFRVLWLLPRVGEWAAVAMELPVILGAAWLISGRLVRDRRLSLTQAGIMGGSAFVWLMLAEAGLSLLLAGRSLSEHLALYAEWPHRLGLAGQLAFAALPLLRHRHRSPP